MGCNPTTGVPILPEHDMELAFDVQFSVEDIMEVRPQVLLTLILCGPIQQGAQRLHGALAAGLALPCLCY